MLSVRVPPAELNISAFPPVLRDWVIKGLGMSSLVYATGHIKDLLPLIAKRRGLSPGGRFPPSFIHQVIIITGLNKLYQGFSTSGSRPRVGLPDRLTESCTVRLRGVALPDRLIKACTVRLRGVTLPDRLIKACTVRLGGVTLPDRLIKACTVRLRGVTLPDRLIKACTVRLRGVALPYLSRVVL